MTAATQKEIDALLKEFTQLLAGVPVLPPHAGTVALVAGGLEVGELADYLSLPHCVRVAKEEGDVAPLLDALKAEMERRFQALEEQHARHVDKLQDPPRARYHRRSHACKMTEGGIEPLKH